VREYLRMNLRVFDYKQLMLICRIYFLVLAIIFAILNSAAIAYLYIRKQRN